MNGYMLKHYKTLGLSYGASHQEIKSAFRKLVVVYHPDKPTGDLKKMQEITEAYTELMRHSQPSARPHQNDVAPDWMVREFEKAADAYVEQLRKRQRSYQESVEEKRKNFESILRGKAKL